MTEKIGEKNYDLGTFIQRGLHEFANSLYPESNIVLRDHAGLYGAKENRDVEPSQPETKTPELEHDEPELDR